MKFPSSTMAAPSAPEQMDALYHPVVGEVLEPHRVHWGKARQSRGVAFQGRKRSSAWVAADEINAMIAKLAVANSWRLIRALGIRVDEREDIQQDLHFALWIRVGRFDASRGAHSTFLRRVAENESRKIIANRIAACRDCRRCVGLDDGRVTCLGRNPFRREEQLILRLDIGRFIESLPPKLRRVAITLKTCSPTEVAGKLGISRETVYDRIRELRTRLVETWAGPCLAPVQPAVVLRTTP